MLLKLCTAPLISAALSLNVSSTTKTQLTFTFSLSHYLSFSLLGFLPTEAPEPSYSSGADRKKNDSTRVVHSTLSDLGHSEVTSQSGEEKKRFHEHHIIAKKITCINFGYLRHIFFHFIRTRRRPAVPHQGLKWSMCKLHHYFPFY